MIGLKFSYIWQNIKLYVQVTGKALLLPQVRVTIINH